MPLMHAVHLQVSSEADASVTSTVLTQNELIKENKNKMPKK